MADTDVDLTKQIKGILSVPNGGTGAATHALGALLVGNAAAALGEIAPGANGNILQVVGGAWTSQPTSSTVVPQRPTAGFTVDTNTQMLYSVDIDLQAANGDLTVNGILQGIR